MLVFFLIRLGKTKLTLNQTLTLTFLSRILLKFINTLNALTSLDMDWSSTVSLKTLWGSFRGTLQKIIFGVSALLRIFVRLYQWTFKSFFRVDKFLLLFKTHFSPNVISNDIWM